MNEENKNKNKAVASLIHWSDGVDKERIERWLKKLKVEGHIRSQETHEYDPSWGSPCWYIP